MDLACHCAGELDRIRSGYYPSLFYPKIRKLAKNLLPQVETIFYIHNFKGSGGGALPPRWQLRHVQSARRPPALCCFLLPSVLHRWGSVPPIEL